MAKRLTTLLIGMSLVAGCGPSEQPPRTVTEFLDNPMLLEAAVVRCAQDRSGNRYDQECINAREAVKRIQAKEEEAQRRELEERSEAKRRALRRTQQAQAEVLFAIHFSYALPVRKYLRQRGDERGADEKREQHGEPSLGR